MGSETFCFSTTRTAYVLGCCNMPTSSIQPSRNTAISVFKKSYFSRARTEWVLRILCAPKIGTDIWFACINQGILSKPEISFILNQSHQIVKKFNFKNRIGFDSKSMKIVVSNLLSTTDRRVHSKNLRTLLDSSLANDQYRGELEHMQKLVRFGKS